MCWCVCVCVCVCIQSVSLGGGYLSSATPSPRSPQIMLNQQKAPYKFSCVERRLNVFLMILFVATLFYHLKLGLQVVLEDYVHNEKAKVVSLALNTLACIFLGAYSIFALVKVAFGG